MTRTADHVLFGRTDLAGDATDSAHRPPMVERGGPRSNRGGHGRRHDEPRHDPPTGPGARAAQQPPRPPRMVRSTAVGSAAAARDPVVCRRHWFHGRSKRASLVPTTSQRPGSPSGSPSTQKPPIVMSYPWVGSMATVQPSFLRYARVVQPGPPVADEESVRLTIVPLDRGRDEADESAAFDNNIVHGGSLR